MSGNFGGDATFEHLPNLHYAEKVTRGCQKRCLQRPVLNKQQHILD